MNHKKSPLLTGIMMLLFTLPSYAQIEMDSNGKVGIAGYTPYSSYGLRVNGRIYSNNWVYGSGFGSWNSDYHGNLIKFYGAQGEVWASLTTDNPGELHINGAKIIVDSDERLKKDKKEIKNASEMLKKLDGRSYFFKSDKELMHIDLGGTRKYGMDTILIGDSLVAVDTRKHKFTLPRGKQFGFIAQEMKETLPELVAYDSASGTYGIDYIGLIPILVEANKELMAKQEDYEERLAALEEKIAELTGESSSARTVDEDPDVSNTEETGQNELFQNNPNPFNQSSEIRFILKEDIQSAALYVYDMQGRQVKSYDIRDRGNVSATIDSGDFKAGMYMYTLIADGQEVGTKKMILTE